MFHCCKCNKCFDYRHVLISHLMKKKRCSDFSDYERDNIVNEINDKITTKKTNKTLTTQVSNYPVTNQQTIPQKPPHQQTLLKHHIINPNNHPHKYPDGNLRGAQNATILTWKFIMIKHKKITRQPQQNLVENHTKIHVESTIGV